MRPRPPLWPFRGPLPAPALWAGCVLGCLAVHSGQLQAADTAPDPAAGLGRLFGLDRRAAAGLARQLAADPLSPAVAGALAPHLAALARAGGEQVARVVDQPGMSVNYEASGGRELLPEVLNGSVKAGTDGAGAELATPIVSYGVNADPGSRVLSATFSFGAPKQLAGGPMGGAELSVRRVVRVEFEYATNRDFLAALGVDASSLPGGRAALTAVSRILNREVPPDPAEVPARGALLSAAEAVKQTLFPNAENFTNVKSVAAGSGYEFTLQLQGKTPGGVSADGSARFLGLEVERRERGVPGVTRYQEAGVGVNLSAGAGGHKAGIGMSVSHTSDPAKQEPNPHAKALANRLRGGEVEVAARAAAEKTALIWDHDRVEKGLRTLVTGQRAAVRDADRIAVTRDPKAGGVVLFFDPDLLETAVPPEELAGALARLTDGLEAGRDRFALRVGEAAESFTTFSLKEWLARTPRENTLGTLTRIRGYFPRGDDLVLVGQAEPGRPRIPVDVLSVALQSVYRDGATPFVSLDPDPAHPFGPQVPRIGGVPPACRESEFVRAMLDADYDMKRINLGELTVPVPGFRSWYDIAKGNSEHAEGYTRYWLAPLPAAAGDVLVGGPAVLFESRVQVLTERMKEAGEFLAPTGESSPAD